MGLEKDCCQTKVSYLNFSLVSIDENIVTFQITMNNRWIVTMQIQKAS